MADNYSNRLSDLTRRFSGESRPLNALAELDSPATTNLNMLAQALRGRSQPRKQLDLQSAMDSAAMGLGPVPVIGDVLGLAADANRFVNEPESRTPFNFGLAALGLLPFMPPLVSAGLGKFAQSQGKTLTAPSMTGPGKNQAGAIVWHGSPHKFDAFDSSKIGTGEGAQAYGHGLYFAENPSVAKSYQVNLTRRDRVGPFKAGLATVDGVPAKNISQDVWEVSDQLSSRNINIDQYIDDLTKKISSAGENASRIEIIKELRDQAQRVAPQLRGKDVKWVEPGHLYKVDLPDEAIAKMLDWDKPLSQQAPEVKKQLKIIGIDPEKHGGTGATLISELKGLPGIPDMPWMGKGESYLRQNNIPGIRYLDGGSRGAGQGTSNYVVFPGNENMLRILSRE